VANSAIACVASSSRSPNLPARCFSICTGLPGLPLFTARKPSGVRTTGTARPSKSTRSCSPSQPVALLAHQLGPGLDDAQRHALGVGAEARHGLPERKGGSRSKPSRSATTAAQSVSTGARLIRMLSPASAMAVTEGAPLLPALDALLNATEPF
jgi:hypothetical protein